MAKQILVTGGTGFTGSHLCRRLLREGHAVRVLARETSRRAALDGADVEWAMGDLCDRPSLEKATQGIDTVYHIAALFRPENVTRQQFQDTNAIGTQNLLEASVNAGVQRFVHCSTVGVHGDIKHPPANEQTPYGPGDAYQDSKVAGEKVALEYAARGRLPVVVFRPGGIFGPGDLRFLKLFKAIRQRKFVMFGSGQVLYQLVYIDDLIDGILQCGTQPQAVGQTYILTGAAPVTLNHLVSEIAQVMQVPPPRLRFPVLPLYWAGFACEALCKPLGINPPLYRRRVDFFRKTRSFDIAKAQQELSFRPKVDLRSGLQRTADWYLAHQYL
ncbi:NAD-dependent epimerase/dehydratase family protein [Altericista sp. CCNU0014]|uniref:NAD-dependent epimerase/dehydratase family protein n=1 Tax=Altericista sp. CCNU0014 TaxID=3082949 RepID=UPI00384B0CCB